MKLNIQLFITMDRYRGRAAVLTELKCGPHTHKHQWSGPDCHEGALLAESAQWFMKRLKPDVMKDVEVEILLDTRHQAIVRFLNQEIKKDGTESPWVLRLGEILWDEEKDRWLLAKCSTTALPKDGARVITRTEAFMGQLELPFD